MFEGIYNSPYQRGAADRAGHEVLGMNGSLSNYVHTGRSKRPMVDTFEQKEAAKKKKAKTTKFAVAITAISAAIATGVALYKKGKLDCISNLKVPFTKGKTIGEFFNGSKLGKWLKMTPEQKLDAKKAKITENTNRRIKNEENRQKWKELQAKLREFAKSEHERFKTEKQKLRQAKNNP